LEEIISTFQHGSNHGFLKYAIMQYFYYYLNDESKQMIDLAAEGTLDGHSG
jgi:hypothetical protein